MSEHIKYRQWKRDAGSNSPKIQETNKAVATAISYGDSSELCNIRLLLCPTVYLCTYISKKFPAKRLQVGKQL
jgi:hypothetical protein